MFSHRIDSSFVLVNSYTVIPFGSRCSSTIACNYAQIRKTSLPFDWTIPLFPKKIQNVLENNFNDFIPDVHKRIFRNKYDFSLEHFNSNIHVGIQEYNRRILRFNTIMSQPTKKYFVYINEDYLYDSNYRQDSFTNTNFNEMLELEQFLQTKYQNIDYNILYMDFKSHNIPINSNIINIILHTTKLYDIPYVGRPYDEFRNYCGKILSELFHTNLSLGYNDSIFQN